MLNWLSASLADALGRIVLKLVATALFARWLSPSIFGEASLTIVVVGLIAIVVTAPFEEALARRRVVRRAHFSAALGVTVIGAIGLVGLTAIAAWSVAQLWPGDSVPTLAGLVAGFALILPAQAAIAVFTALARRRRRFSTIAWANLAGDVIGTACGLALGLAGFGVWALLSVRLISRSITALVLIATSPARIGLVPQRAPLADLGGFAGWFFVARGIDKIADVIFQGLVARWFGLGGLGYLNMALRIIEPIRGPTASVSHNIALSYFMRAQDTPERLRAAVAATVSQTALALLPVYLGLAAVAPTTIAILAGPDWAAAGTIARVLAMAAAIAAVTHFLMTALAARGRARTIALAFVIELATGIVALWLLSSTGWIAIGLAKLVSTLVLAAVYLVSARRAFGLSIMNFLAHSLPAAMSAGVMALAVGLLAGSAWPGGPLIGQLALQILGGALLFGLLAMVFHRATLDRIRAVLGRNRRSAAVD